MRQHTPVNIANLAPLTSHPKEALGQRMGVLVAMVEKVERKDEHARQREDTV